MATHQAPLSLGFSRQEHWSGLPFPSPMYESEKWKWSRSVVSDLSDPVYCSLPGSSLHGIFQSRVLEWVAISFSVLAEETPNFEPKWPDIIFYRSVPRNWTLTVLLQCSNILLAQIFKMKVHPVSTVYTLFIYSILDMIIFCLHRLTSSLLECELYSGICF